MKTQATAKSLPTSSRKVGLVADLVRGQSATRAASLLAAANQKAASLVAQVLASAVANAQTNYQTKKADLMVEQILVGPGPTLKRFRPRAKGAAARIRHRTAHVTVILSDEASKADVPAAKPPAAAGGKK